MESIVNTFSYEMEYGGPHVHFLAFFIHLHWHCHPARRLPDRHRSAEPRDENPARQLAQYLPFHADSDGHPHGHPVDQGYPESA